MRVLRPWLTFSLALTAACSTGTPVTSRGGSTATSANTTPPPPNPPPVHQAADIPPASPLPMAADETYDLSKDEARIGKLARTELGERVAIETVEGVFVFVCAPSWSGASCRGSVDFLSRALVALRNHRFDRLPSRAVGVYLFGDDTTYERYCKDTWKAPCISPYGFYSPTERRLVMNLGLGVGTLTHEIVHPLVEADFPGAPTWIDEGIASLFEAPLMAARGEIHGAKNWRYPKLAARLRGEHPVRLDDLFGMSGETFRNEEESVHYALARYVCQWLDSRGELWSFYRAWRDGIVSDPTGEKSFTKTVGMTPAEANDEFSRWARRL